jgi:hypothetical protein
MSITDFILVLLPLILCHKVSGHLQALLEIPSQYWLPEGHNDVRARWNAMTEDQKKALAIRIRYEEGRWLTWNW